MVARDKKLPNPNRLDKKYKVNCGVSAKRPDLEDRFFRSISEANYARYLNLMIKFGQEGRMQGNVITRWEYEPERFDFHNKSKSFYVPDFKVWYSDGTYQWHEVKGWMNNKSRRKIENFKKYYYHEYCKLVVINSSVYLEIRNQFAGMITNWETMDNTEMIRSKDK